MSLSGPCPWRLDAGGKCVERGFLGLHLAFQTGHDAADPVIDLMIQLVNQGLDAGDMQIGRGIIVCQSDEGLLRLMQFAQQIGQG